MPVQNNAITVSYFAEDLLNGGGVTGDVGNHTLRLIVDGTEVSPTGTKLEVGATNIPGWYKITLESNENTGDMMVLGGKSSTSDVAIRGLEWFNAPISSNTLNTKLDTIDGVVDDLTTTIGISGSGLIELGGMSDGMKAEIRESNERLYGIDRWSLYGDDELFSDEANDNGINTWPSVFYDATGSVYRCYYTAKDSSGDYIIRHRSSSDGKTSWSSGTTILTPGGVGEWDETGPWAAVVWKEGATYHMLYTSRDKTNYAVKVGYATSSSATSGWTKYGSNPVMSPSFDWEHNSTEVTGIIKIDSTYHMFYTNLNSSITLGDFPSYARKVGYATSTDLLSWTKQSEPVFGDSDGSYDNQPYHGYYSSSPFKYGNLYYLVTSRYGFGREDYSQFELWSSADINFSANIRKRVGIIMTTNVDGNYPNEDIDIVSFASDDTSFGITRTYTYGDEVRMYFGTAHFTSTGAAASWSTALATQVGIREALRFVPSIQTDIISKLPTTRWALAASGIAENVWDAATRDLSGTINSFDELNTVLDSAHSAGSWATATGFATSTNLEAVSGVIVARTIVTADYFDPAVDVVANVTLVDTTTDVTNIIDSNVVQISGEAVSVVEIMDANVVQISGEAVSVVEIMDANVVQVSGEEVSIEDFRESSTIAASDIWSYSSRSLTETVDANIIQVSGENVDLGNFITGSGLATTTQLNNWGLILLNHLRDVGIEP